MRSSILVATLLALPAAAQAQSMRCDRRLVSVGDTSVELRAKCGPPDHVAHRVRLVAEGVRVPRGVPVRDRRTVTSDVRYVRERVGLWTYAGDEGALGRVVMVRRGEVVAIETLGRTALERNPDCAKKVSRGTRTGTVKLTCGAPVDVSSWQEERVVTRADGFESRVLVEHERWTYDPGEGRFLRILHFVNGRLVRSETGGRSP